MTETVENLVKQLLKSADELYNREDVAVAETSILAGIRVQIQHLQDVLVHRVTVCMGDKFKHKDTGDLYIVGRLQNNLYLFQINPGITCGNRWSDTGSPVETFIIGDVIKQATRFNPDDEGTLFDNSYHEFEKCTPEPKKPGVFIIRNNKTGRIFIGYSEEDVAETVYTYMVQLDHNEFTTNRYLQNSYNKHGRHWFTHEVVHECSAEEVLQKYDDLKYAYRELEADLYNF